MTVVREDPPFDGDEKTTLVAFLDFHRATLRQKCDGLTPAQLIEQACPPSTLRLLGLVRHLTEVESAWFSQVLNGDPEYDVYATDADRDADLNIAVADEASVAATWARYDEEVARSRAVTNCRQLGDLAARTTRRGEQPTLRWVLVHLIEEYARHNGHADLLREAIDGSTGE